MNNLSQLSQLANIAIRKGDADAVLVLNLSEVLTKPQVRKHFTGIEELGENLKMDGQHHPIVVFPKNKNGKYVIQKGERRYRACKAAGLKTIKAIVNTAILDKLDEVAGELGENIHRADLTSFEIADALNEFILMDWSQVDISRRINKSRPYVSLHLSLMRIPEAIRALLPTDITNDTTTLNMVAQIHEIDPEACRALCEQAMQDKGLSRGTARRALEKLRGNEQEVQEAAQGGQATLPQGRGKKGASTPVSGDSAGGAAEKEDGIGDPTLPGAESHADSPRKNPIAQNAAASTTVATKRNESHKQPGDVTTVIPGVPEGSSFGIVSPAQIKVVCRIELFGVKRLGELCLNRVDKETELVWVKLYAEDGKPSSNDADAEYVSVQGDKVQIMELCQLKG